MGRGQGNAHSNLPDMPQHPVYSGGSRGEDGGRGRQFNRGGGGGRGRGRRDDWGQHGRGGNDGRGASRGPKAARYGNESGGGRGRGGPAALATWRKLDCGCRVTRLILQPGNN
eukprot:jgi/Mesen1/2069/ME000150S01159